MSSHQLKFLFFRSCMTDYLLIYKLKRLVVLCSMCSLCGNNVDSFSHLFFCYSIDIHLWILWKEVFQDLLFSSLNLHLQFSYLDLIVQYIKSLCNLLLKVIVSNYLDDKKMRYHSRFQAHITIPYAIFQIKGQCVWLKTNLRNIRILSLIFWC